MCLKYIILRSCLIKKYPPCHLQGTLHSPSVYLPSVCFFAQLLGLYEECLNPVPPPTHVLLPICSWKCPCWLFVAVVCEICIKAEQLETKLVHFKRWTFLLSLHKSSWDRDRGFFFCCCCWGLWGYNYIQLIHMTCFYDLRRKHNASYLQTDEFTAVQRSTVWFCEPMH